MCILQQQFKTLPQEIPLLPLPGSMPLLLLLVPPSCKPQVLKSLGKENRSGKYLPVPLRDFCLPEGKRILKPEPHALEAVTSHSEGVQQQEEGRVMGRVIQTSTGKEGNSSRREASSATLSTQKGAS